MLPSTQNLLNLCKANSMPRLVFAPRKHLISLHAPRPMPKDGCIVFACTWLHNYSRLMLPIEKLSSVPWLMKQSPSRVPLCHHQCVQEENCCHELPLALSSKGKAFGLTPLTVLSSENEFSFQSRKAKVGTHGDSAISISGGVLCTMHRSLCKKRAQGKRNKLCEIWLSPRATLIAYEWKGTRRLRGSTRLLPNWLFRRAMKGSTFVVNQSECCARNAAWNFRRNREFRPKSY